MKWSHDITDTQNLSFTLTLNSSHMVQVTEVCNKIPVLQIRALQQVTKPLWVSVSSSKT